MRALKQRTLSTFSANSLQFTSHCGFKVGSKTAPDLRTWKPLHSPELLARILIERQLVVNDADGLEPVPLSDIGVILSVCRRMRQYHVVGRCHLIGVWRRKNGAFARLLVAGVL